ncbi:TPM domain-containing protein [Thermosulfuriphilus sp.]
MKTFPHPFDPAGQQKIAQAIAQAEKATAAEIAVMVVSQSGRYREAEILSALILGHLLAFVLTVGLFSASLWHYVPLEFGLSLASYPLIRRFPFLKKPLIGPRRRAEKVFFRAQRAFLEQGLHQTKEATGVLIFISLFERRVMILADKGIMAHVSQEALDRWAKKLAQKIKQGQAIEGLCEIIKEMGQSLAQHLPVRPGDINELPDEIIFRQE